MCPPFSLSHSRLLDFRHPFRAAQAFSLDCSMTYYGESPGKRIFANTLVLYCSGLAIVVVLPTLLLGPAYLVVRVSPTYACSNQRVTRCIAEAVADTLYNHCCHWKGRRV